jgi:tetratricopeptide (TPR) repeat protein
MMRRALFLVFAVSLFAAQAWALDSVKKLSGPTVSGTIKAVTKNDVDIEKTAGGVEKVPVTDVDYVRYDGEPVQLAGVRAQTNNGSYDTALKQLAGIAPATVTKPETQQEVQFYKAYCTARLALAGNGDVAAAGKGLTDWLGKNPNSYHFYPATELVGDLLVKAGNFEPATTYYAQLEQAAAPELKMRSSLGIGRSLLAQKKFPEAQAAFDKVLTLASTAKGAQADQQRFAATLGKASCVGETGSPDDAIKSIEDVIKGVNPENADLMAQAYVTLGKVYLKKPDAKKQALLAFLHVDTLYSANAAAHAEALRQLDPLWRDLGKPERALQAVELLRQKYAGGN